MATAQYKDLNHVTVTDATEYKTRLDANALVAQELVAGFQVHESTPPAMSVELPATAVLDPSGPTRTAVTAQTLGSIPIPSTNPRLDLVSVDPATGTATRTAGTEAASPVLPAIPAGERPLAQISLTTSMTEITNLEITDLRVPAVGMEDPAAGGDFAQAVRAYLSSATQSISNGAWTTIIFDGEAYDTDTMHDSVTNNTRITFTTAGKYHVTWHVLWDSNVTGGRLSRMQLNGGGNQIWTIDKPFVSSGVNTRITRSIDFDFSAGDYIEIHVFQDSGGTRTISGGAGLRTHITAHKIAD